MVGSYSLTQGREVKEHQEKEGKNEEERNQQ